MILRIGDIRLYWLFSYLRTFLEFFLTILRKGHEFFPTVRFPSGSVLFLIFPQYGKVTDQIAKIIKKYF